MEIDKGTLVGIGRNGFCITMGDLYPSTRAKLNSHANMQKALKEMEVLLKPCKGIGLIHSICVKALAKAEVK